MLGLSSSEDTGEATSSSMTGDAERADLLVLLVWILLLLSIMYTSSTLFCDIFKFFQLGVIETEKEKGKAMREKGKTTKYRNLGVYEIQWCSTIWAPFL